MLEIAENITLPQGRMGGYSWLSNENPSAITSLQSFGKLESMWMNAMHDNDTSTMITMEELWDMLTTQAYNELLDYGLGLGIPYQGGVTLGKWAEKSLSNTQEGSKAWMDASAEIAKNVFIKAAAYVLGGLSICSNLNFKPAFNMLPSEGGIYVLSPSPPPPLREIFDPSDNELLFKQQFGIRNTARLKLGLRFQGIDNILDTMHSTERVGKSFRGICATLNISQRKCPRETMLGLLAVETACLAYGANALLNATNESWLEGKTTEVIAVEALEACMMRPTVRNTLYR